MPNILDYILKGNKPKPRDPGAEEYDRRRAEEERQRKEAEAPAPEKPKEDNSGGLLGGAVRALKKDKTEGYADGGYTGDIPTTEVAGPAHGQEYVIPAEVVNYLGRKYFDDLVAKASSAATGAANPITQFDASLDLE